MILCRTSILLLLCAALCVCAAGLHSQTLYCATGSNGATGDLYKVDAGTGQGTLIGTILVSGSKVSVTGMAFDPTSGKLYAITNGQSLSNANSLLTIDTSTAVATLIGALSKGCSDVAFDSTGKLYGWQPGNSVLCTINKATGAQTVLGASGISHQSGGGLSIDSGGTGWLCATGANGTIDKCDMASGAVNTGATMSGASQGWAMNALAFELSSGKLYAANTDGGGTVIVDLVVIDSGSGGVSVIGNLPDDTDALAWDNGSATPPPTLTNVNPASGTTSGGTGVTLTGTNFTGATSVTFGGTAATNLNVSSATTIKCDTPAHTAGAVSVIVTTPGGQNGANTLYTYVASGSPPTVSGLAPTSGTTAGGTSVVITGTNFTGTTSVTFGGTTAGFTVNSATQITATSPAHAAGVVDVLVTTPSGTSANTAADNYTYVTPAPTITGLAPTSGTTAGGTSVVITGTNFTGTTSVTFSGTAAAGFTVNSATQITATSPAHAAGATDVAVTTPSGTSANTAADNYTYNTPAIPTVTSLAPTSGTTAGGTSVVITGTNMTGTTGVTFGGTAATLGAITATTVTVTSPAHAAGLVDVLVTTSAGTSANTSADDYTYVIPPPAPTVTSLAPTNGTTAGGTSVVITGTNLTGTTSVTFGGTAATLGAITATSVTVTSPAHAAGLVDVLVTTPGGTSANTSADDYTYTVPLAAEMDVTRGATPVADNSPSDPLGSVPFGVAQTVTYTITNSGTAGLNLTGTPVVQVTAGANVSSVSVTTPPATTSVAASGTVTFTLTYTVTAAGVFGFDVSIANNDANENPYNWNADGTGTATPEIDVTRGATAIADGSTDTVGNAAFGAASNYTYTITNSGNGNLTLTTPVTPSGLVNCTVTVTTQPTSPVAAAGTTTLVIAVTPVGTGTFSCQISIANNDANENPYNWTLSGTGTTLGATGNGTSGGGGGCSTEENGQQWMLLAGAIATLGLALRLRRRAA